MKLKPCLNCFFAPARHSDRRVILFVHFPAKRWTAVHLFSTSFTNHWPLCTVPGTSQVLTAESLSTWIRSIKHLHINSYIAKLLNSNLLAVSVCDFSYKLQEIAIGTKPAIVIKADREPDYTQRSRSGVWSTQSTRFNNQSWRRKRSLKRYL